MGFAACRLRIRRTEGAATGEKSKSYATTDIPCRYSERV